MLKFLDRPQQTALQQRLLLVADGNEFCLQLEVVLRDPADHFDLHQHSVVFGDARQDCDVRAKLIERIEDQVAALGLAVAAFHIDFDVA